jgi:1,3-beta-galactosyl-N-acetylhexosamine phosphorylase
LIRRLGADAVRNSDGTEVPPELTRLGLTVYSKYFVNRGDPKWAAAHPEQIQELYLMSRPVTATGPKLNIEPLDGFYAEQFRVDLEHDPKRWWEVRDRTAGGVLETDRWNVAETDGIVHVEVTGAVPGHEHTVAFLAWNIWEPVQMYNHLTNDWGDRPHDPAMDALHPTGRARALERLAGWLEANPGTDVVRFTTFLYQFTLIYDAAAREKHVDWFGYAATVSPAALDAFEAAHGYRLTPEDFVDEGYYHSTARPLSQRWRDWMEFTRQGVQSLARELVALVHQRGRQAMMFLGDQWIGTEPYGPDFASIGLDAVVGSIGDAATTRIIADIPGTRLTEGRLLPYFFPDVFHPGGDPAGEALTSWLKARRAMLRHPVDRIGWGGYPSLAAEHPAFLDVAERIADEFRQIHRRRGGGAPWTLGGRVAVLNEWGALRPWLTYTVAHGLPLAFTEPYAGLMEALAGLPFEVCWLSFEEVARGGVPADVAAVVNAGPAGTSFSGGAWWGEPRLVAALRQWTWAGGFLLGVGEPSALARQGRTFQLADLLGVDQEIGFSLPRRRYPELCPDHWVAKDLPADFAVPGGARSVYAIEGGARVVRQRGEDVLVAVNRCGHGRSAYLAGLPNSAAGARLAHRVVAWGMGLADDELPYLPDNPAVDLAAYPASGALAAANSTLQPQAAVFLDGSGRRREIELGPGELAWLRL